MKVQLTMSDFPMQALNRMITDLASRHDGIDVQVGGGDTVYVTFSSDDICKIQVLSIICDKYYFGGDALEPEDKLLLP